MTAAQRWGSEALLWLLVAAAIAVGAYMLGRMTADHSPAPRPAPTVTSTCTEDMSCWDCRTMGNRQCGPTTVEV
jgi:hypothetical protein